MTTALVDFPVPMGDAHATDTALVGPLIGEAGPVSVQAKEPLLEVTPVMMTVVAVMVTVPPPTCLVRLRAAKLIPPSQPMPYGLLSVV